jgi:hypothetical protein
MFYIDPFGNRLSLIWGPGKVGGSSFRSMAGMGRYKGGLTTAWKNEGTYSTLMFDTENQIKDAAIGTGDTNGNGVADHLGSLPFDPSAAEATSGGGDGRFMYILIQ